METEWPEARLRDHIDLIVGPAFSSALFREGPPGIKLVRGDNITEGRLRWGGKSRYWPRLTDDLGRYLLRPGDVLVGMDGSKVGRNWAQVRETDLPLLLVQRVACIRARKTLDQGFLSALVASDLFKGHVNAVRTGSSIPHISAGQIGEFSFLLPPLGEQRAIAHILGTLHEKMELNQLVTETLTAITQALFRSWFVDFGPVRAKAAGRPVGVPRAVADLFAGRLVATRLGETPEGWQLCSVSDVCNAIFSGGTPSRTMPTFWGGGIPWLSSGETRSTFIVATEETITSDGVAHSSTRFAKAGATVIASAGQGRTRGQTSMLMIDSYINQSVVALQANPERVSNLYLFFDLEARYEQFRRLSDAHSSRGSLTTRLLADLPLVLPPRDLIHRFGEVAAPVVERIRVALVESRTLAAMRETLLPELLTRKLRAPQAQKMLEAMPG